MKELVEQLISAPSCCKEAKEKAEKYLNSIGTDDEQKCLDELINELKSDITIIDELISLLSSDLGIQIFGKERCEEMLAHANDIKEKGAKYCDCLACTTALNIIELNK